MLFRFLVEIRTGFSFFPVFPHVFICFFGYSMSGFPARGQGKMVVFHTTMVNNGNK